MFAMHITVSYLFFGLTFFFVCIFRSPYLVQSLFFFEYVFNIIRGLSLSIFIGSFVMCADKQNCTPNWTSRSWPVTTNVTFHSFLVIRLVAAVCISELSITINETTRRRIPNASDRHI
jgi:hypothetical protein